jgi:hypothetical protein
MQPACREVHRIRLVHRHEEVAAVEVEPASTEVVMELKVAKVEEVPMVSVVVLVVVGHCLQKVAARSNLRMEVLRAVRAAVHLEELPKDLEGQVRPK